MARYTIECDRCGERFVGRDEYEAEVKWNAHNCQPKGKRNLDDMPFDLLREVVYGRITEDEAWAKFDVRMVEA